MTCDSGIFKTADEYFEKHPAAFQSPHPTPKVARHRELCLSLNELYAKKNADYGDSFHLSYIDEGMAMPRIRLGDKFNRFKQLSKTGISQVNDESIRDTLLDLANYAIMTVLELDEEQGQTTSISS